MHTESLEHWRHDHTFGQDRIRAGERRTLLVIAITATMMVVEVAAGWLYGSMALLADGLHMASHATALGISAAAYVYARRYARDRRFTFGTGKVNALAGFTGALLLAVFALGMAGESVNRLFHPVAIVFNQAIFVAVLGLIVNGASMWILGDHHEHEHAHEHAHEPEVGHGHAHEHDHNLRSAYLHVLADALTSVFAIVALLAGKYLGQNWLDPAMGVVGAILVARWSWGLLRQTTTVLLDHEGPDRVREAIRAAIEAGSNDRVADLHVWSIGPGIYAAALALVSHEPQAPEYYKRRIPTGLGVVHITVEVHPCSDVPEPAHTYG